MMGGFIYMVTCKRRPSSLLHYRKTNLPFFLRSHHFQFWVLCKEKETERRKVFTD